MKRLLLLNLFVVFFISSCSVRDDYDENQLTLDEFLHSYDLWMVNVNATRGNDRIPFLQKAFTLTFSGNTLLSNNNLVGIGSIGGGYGRTIGQFYASDTQITVHHDQDGAYRFRVEQVSVDEIDLYDLNSDAVYRLEGYHKYNFNYDRLFFDNLRYFLQEYTNWEKTYTSQQGAVNPFDEENFLRFFSLGGDYVFETKDYLSRPMPLYQGIYTIDNINNVSDVKLLSLHYPNGIEQFEIKVLNDREIELFHINSRTIYRFSGTRNIIYKKLDSQAK